MLLAKGDFAQVEAVKRLRYMEFYMALRLMQERNERERENNTKRHGKDTTKRRG